MIRTAIAFTEGSDDALAPWPASLPNATKGTAHDRPCPF